MAREYCIILSVICYKTSFLSFFYSIRIPWVVIQTVNRSTLANYYFNRRWGGPESHRFFFFLQSLTNMTIITLNFVKKVQLSHTSEFTYYFLSLVCENKIIQTLISPMSSGNMWKIRFSKQIPNIANLRLYWTGTGYMVFDFELKNTFSVFALFHIFKEKFFTILVQWPNLKLEWVKVALHSLISNFPFNIRIMNNIVP